MKPLTNVVMFIAATFVAGIGIETKNPTTAMAGLLFAVLTIGNLIVWLMPDKKK